MALVGALMPSGMDIKSELKKALASMAYAKKPEFIAWQNDGIHLAGCDAVQLYESQADGSVALFEGHLDNKQEIAHALNIASEPVCSDAQLLLLAWRRWGGACLLRWVGRFACIVWEGKTKQLVLGVDALGARSMHFWQNKDLFLFASEPRGLLVQPWVSKALNRTYIADILAFAPPDPAHCIFSDIQRLPAGHVLMVQDKKIRLQRYWQPEQLSYLHLPRTKDYAEALRFELEQAVACRLPASGLVGCYLSAGLDSPSVAAIAARQLAKQGRSLVAFTAVPRKGFVGKPNPHYIYDEGPLAALVAACYPNIEHVLIPNNTLPLFDAIDIQGQNADIPAPNASNVRWSLAIGEELRRRGISLMLTGNFGNMSLSYDGIMAPAALLRQGRLFDLLSILLGLRKEGYSWPGVIGAMISPLFPSVHKAYRHLRGRPIPKLHDYSLINPDLARQTGVLERASHDLRFMANADGRRLRLLAIERSNGLTGPTMSAYRRLFGAEYTDPLMDRRLFEFCLSIPEEQFVQKGEPRSLVRSVMADLLPSELLTERRRGHQAADWYEGLNQAYPEILKEITLLEASPIAAQCLDLIRMRKLVENWPQNNFDHPNIRPLYAQGLARALSMGRFLRRVECSPTYPLS